MKKRHAFTLIEMLVVIAIIGIVAALVVNMNAGAQAAKRNAQVNADKSKLMTMINNYQSKLNFYPPDNGNLANYSLANYAANYDAWAAINPLLYELTGATNTTNGYIQAFDGTTNVSTNIYYQVFGRQSVANSNPDEPHNFFQPGPQPKEYTNYYSASGTSNVWGLLVPVSMVSPTGTPITNFWHYDASSTNRHNLSGYDLWAEYLIGSKNGSNIIMTNGNW
jgi:prepilin-type N-terminal cleavage/methylation domain-containing protein